MTNGDMYGGDVEYYNGVCLICGREIQEDDSYLYVRILELCPSRFDAPITIKAMAICVNPCYQKIADHLIYNAANQGRVKLRK